MGRQADLSAASLTEAALAVLEEERSGLAASGASDAYERAVMYALGRYGIGIEHYADALERIGFGGVASVLDLGSGAGHWCVALARTNDRVHGVERSEEFVAIARRVAQGLGLGERIVYEMGAAEEAAYERESFDLACCHSVLMYVNHELVLRKAAAWLRTGGRFYIGYTGLGMRLAGMDRAVAAGDADQLRAALGIVLAQQLYRCGVQQTLPRVRMFDPEELIAVAEAAGFALADRPGVQDGAGAYAGIPRTYDLVLEKTDGDPLKRSLRTLVGGDPAALAAALRDAVSAGLPGVVLEVVDELPSALDDEGLRAVRALALAKAGRVDRSHVHALGPLPDAVLGRVQYEAGNLPAAVGSFKRGIDSDDDARFLLAYCLLRTGDSTAAEELFVAEAETGSHWFRGALGHIAAATGGDDDAEALRRAAHLLEHVKHGRSL